MKACKDCKTLFQNYQLINDTCIFCEPITDSGNTDLTMCDYCNEGHRHDEFFDEYEINGTWFMCDRWCQAQINDHIDSLLYNE